MPYLKTADGSHIYYEDIGKGRPIVLVHGWPLSHQMFENSSVPLAEKGYRVISLDLKGFGESSHVWNGCDYDTWVKDIATLIQSLDLRDVTLGGFSMGGAISIRYVATQNDPRIAQLALFGSAGPCFTQKNDFPQGVPVEICNALIDETRADRPKVANDFTKLCFHKAPSEFFVRWFDGIQLRGSARAFIRGMEELRDQDFRPMLDKINVPTRLFHGIHDKVVPFALGEYQHSKIKGSTLVQFHESGHGLNIDEPPKFFSELLKFLEEFKLQKKAA